MARRARPPRTPRSARWGASSSACYAAGALDDAGYAARLAAWRTRAQRPPARRPAPARARRRDRDDRGDRGARRAHAPARVAPLWLTLARNVEWWTTRPLLASGQRVGFAGSELVWQYFPGQGVQLQALASFGKLNGLWEGRRYDPRMAHLLDELLALRVERAGGVTWEYFFTSPAAAPPWVSAWRRARRCRRSRASAPRLGRQAEVLPIAQQALRLFEQAPPTGVRVADGPRALPPVLLPPRPAGAQRVPAGAHRALRLRGAHRRRARRALFATATRRRARGAALRHGRVVAVLARGDDARVRPRLPHARARLPRRPVPAHRPAPSTATADRFTAYLTQPPQLALRSKRAARRRAARLGFPLSKIARASVRVTTRAGAPVLGPPALLGRGTRSVAWKVPRKAGLYVVTVAAIDLAGNAERRRARRVLKPSAATRAVSEVDSPAVMAPRTILYTGKGGVGKTSVAAATARRMRRRRPAHARALDGPRALAGRRARDGRRARADRGRRAPARPAGRRPARARAQLVGRPGLAGRRARRARRRPHRRRGAHGPARRRRAVQPPAAQGAREVGRLGRARGRLRADRRDAAAALLPRRRALVAGPLLGREAALLAAARPIARAFLDLTLPGEEAVGELQRLVGNLVAMDELLRDRARSRCGS